MVKYLKERVDTVKTSFFELMRQNVKGNGKENIIDTIADEIIKIVEGGNHE